MQSQPKHSYFYPVPPIAFHIAQMGGSWNISSTETGNRSRSRAATKCDPMSARTPVHPSPRERHRSRCGVGCGAHHPMGSKCKVARWWNGADRNAKSEYGGPLLWRWAKSDFSKPTDCMVCYEFEFYRNPSLRSDHDPYTHTPFSPAYDARNSRTVGLRWGKATCGKCVSKSEWTKQRAREPPTETDIFRVNIHIFMARWRRYVWSTTPRALATLAYRPREVSGKHRYRLSTDNWSTPLGEG